MTATPTPYAQLVLVRHGESANNAVERFSGWRDIELTGRGRAQAAAAGRLLRQRGAQFSAVFTSMLRRATETAQLLLQELGQQPPIESRWRLNERHCGAMQGMDKAETYRVWGAEQAREFRRSWTVPPPPAAAGSEDDPRIDPRYREAAGELPLTESMGDLWRRVDRCWRDDLRPRLLGGARVLVVGHGMALRALARSVERIDEPALPPWKLASAAPRWYRLDRGLGIESVEDLGGAGDAPEE